MKDLVVLLCIVLFGYPALIAVPPAYMLSDLIEGVPPDFVLNWAEGYFFWTAFVWMAYQLIGRNPDFRRAQTWRRYGVFVVLIMLFDPVMWGFICSGQFTSAISYRNISSALFFTLTVTWLLAPGGLSGRPAAGQTVRMVLGGDPRTRQRARDWGQRMDLGSRPRQTPGDAGPVQEGLPIRIFIFTPFIALVLVMVGATAIVALRSADDDAARLATQTPSGSVGEHPHAAGRLPGTFAVADGRPAQGRSRLSAAKPGHRLGRSSLHPRQHRRDRSPRPLPTATRWWRVRLPVWRSTRVRRACLQPRRSSGSIT